MIIPQKVAFVNFCLSIFLWEIWGYFVIGGAHRASVWAGVRGCLKQPFRLPTAATSPWQGEADRALRFQSTKPFLLSKRLLCVMSVTLEPPLCKGRWLPKADGRVVLNERLQPYKRTRDARSYNATANNRPPPHKRRRRTKNNPSAVASLGTSPYTGEAPR